MQIPNIHLGSIRSFCSFEAQPYHRKIRSGYKEIQDDFRCIEQGSQALNHPAMLRKRGLPDLQIRHMHGQDFPEDLSGTDLVIHCGGCMLNNKAMLSRIFQCRQQNVPFTNYGVCIAFCTGILERALSPFPEALKAFRNAMAEKDV